MPIEANISAIDSRPHCCPAVTAGRWRRRLDVQLFDVEVAELGRRREPVVDQDA
jgi:hypothetical protein